MPIVRNIFIKSFSTIIVLKDIISENIRTQFWNMKSICFLMNLILPRNFRIREHHAIQLTLYNVCTY